MNGTTGWSSKITESGKEARGVEQSEAAESPPWVAATRPSAQPEPPGRSLTKAKPHFYPYFVPVSFSWGSKGPLLRGTWLAQSMDHATLDLGAVSSGPTLGIEVT